MCVCVCVSVCVCLCLSVCPSFTYIHTHTPRPPPSTPPPPPQQNKKYSNRKITSIINYSSPRYDNPAVNNKTKQSRPVRTPINLTRARQLFGSLTFNQLSANTETGQVLANTRPPPPPPPPLTPPPPHTHTHAHTPP